MEMTEARQKSIHARRACHVLMTLTDAPSGVFLAFADGDYVTAKPSRATEFYLLMWEDRPLDAHYSDADYAEMFLEQWMRTRGL